MPGRRVRGPNPPPSWPMAGWSLSVSAASFPVGKPPRASSSGSTTLPTSFPPPHRSTARPCRRWSTAGMSSPTSAATTRAPCGRSTWRPAEPSGSGPAMGRPILRPSWRLSATPGSSLRSRRTPASAFRPPTAPCCGACPTKRSTSRTLSRRWCSATWSFFPARPRG